MLSFRLPSDKWLWSTILYFRDCTGSSVVLLVLQVHVLKAPIVLLGNIRINEAPNHKFIGTWRYSSLASYIWTRWSWMVREMPQPLCSQWSGSWYPLDRRSGRPMARLNIVAISLMYLAGFILHSSSHSLVTIMAKLPQFINYVEALFSSWLQCHCGQHTCFPALLLLLLLLFYYYYYYLLLLPTTTTTTMYSTTPTATTTAAAVADDGGGGDDDDTNSNDDSDFLLQRHHLSVYVFISKENEKLLYLKYCNWSVPRWT